MMGVGKMSKDNGGPAFPSKASGPGVAQALGMGVPVSDCHGMTLRQYYMAHAPFTLDDARYVAEAVGGKNVTGEGLIKIIVNMRADYADAMLAERVK
jgi:hypothetical protein